MINQTLISHKATDKKDSAYCKKIIRDLGLKVTQQRLIILEEIVNGGNHVTAQDVFENTSKVSPDMGFATVYRFLRTLSEQGYISEVRMRGLPARYEWADKQHHDHLTCSGCGLICEFENVEIERLQVSIANQMGFTLTDHVLELYGLCAKCQVVQQTSGTVHIGTKLNPKPEGLSF